MIHYFELWWYCQSFVPVCMCVCVYMNVSVCICREWVSVLPILLRIGDEIYRTSIHTIHYCPIAYIHPYVCTDCCTIHQYTQRFVYICTNSSSSSSWCVYIRTHAHTQNTHLHLHTHTPNIHDYMMNFSSVVDEHFFFIWSNIRCNINWETHRKKSKGKTKERRFLFFVVVEKFI